MTTLLTTISAHVVPDQGSARAHVGTNREAAQEITDSMETAEFAITQYAVTVDVSGFPASGFTFMHFRVGGGPVTLEIDQNATTATLTVQGVGMMTLAPVTGLRARLPTAESQASSIEFLLAW